MLDRMALRPSLGFVQTRHAQHDLPRPRGFPGPGRSARAHLHTGDAFWSRAPQRPGCPVLRRFVPRPEAGEAGSTVAEPSAGSLSPAQVTGSLCLHVLHRFVPGCAEVNGPGLTLLGPKTPRTGQSGRCWAPGRPEAKEQPEASGRQARPQESAQKRASSATTAPAVRHPAAGPRLTSGESASPRAATRPEPRGAALASARGAGPRRGGGA